MTPVIAPWISFSSRGGLRIESGVYCAACVHNPDQTQIYTMEGFKEHLRHCRIQPFHATKFELWEYHDAYGHGRLSLAEDQTWAPR